MTKLSLCIKDTNDLNKLTEGKLDTVKVTMVSDEVSQEASNEWVRLVPYVTFYAVNPEEGRVEFIQHQVKQEDEKAKAGTSAGFGSPIVYGEDDIATPFVTEEDSNTVSYNLNIKDLLETITNKAYAEVKEVLNVDIKEGLGKEINSAGIIFFKGIEDNEYNKTNMAFGCLVPLTVEELKSLKDTYNENEEAVLELAVLGVNFGEIVRSFNINQEVIRLSTELRNNHGLADWSCIMVESVVNGFCRMITSDLSWNAIYQAHVDYFNELQEKLEAEKLEAEKEEEVEEVEVVEEKDADSSKEV